MPIEDRDYYRERRGTAPRPQGRRSRGGGRRRTATAVNPGGRSSGGHGCCWLILLLLIAAIGGGYYWYTQYGLPIEIEFLPTPTSTPQAVQEGTPTPTPDPSPAPPTPTPYPCADPTLTPDAPLEGTPTPASPAPFVPSATPTPAWEAPEPLSDEWRERASGWSREQVDAALAESLAVFDSGLDDLGSLLPVDACRRVAVFEVHLETAEFLVDEHGLEREPVPGQGAAALSWMIWLRHQRGLFAEAVQNHAPVAECRRLLAPPTPMPTHTLAPPTATPTLGPPTATPLPPCPTATPTPPPTATPTATATPRPTATATPRPITTPTATSEPEQQFTAREVQGLRLFALELINNDRAAHGLPAVTLGLNEAAQLHAEDMLQYDYQGHWWIDGRKPYMVYSDTGGTSYAAENAASSGWTDSEWRASDCDGLFVDCVVPVPRASVERL